MSRLYTTASLKSVAELRIQRDYAEGLSQNKSKASFGCDRMDHLQYISEEEDYFRCRLIPASRQEKLSYFRTFVCLAYKIPGACIGAALVNHSIWNFVSRNIFRSFPYIYIHIYLGIYVPMSHMFLGKMIPLFKGLQYFLVLTAFIDLIEQSFECMIHLDFVAQGFSRNLPWRRCKPYTMGDLKVFCAPVQEISHKYQNCTLIEHVGAHHLYYCIELNETFTTPELKFFSMRLDLYNVNPHILVNKPLDFLRSIPKTLKQKLFIIIYMNIIWLSAALCAKLTYNKRFWKLLNIGHWVFNAMTFIILLDLIFISGAVSIMIPVESGEKYREIIKMDTNQLSDVVGVPTVLHFLTARSVDEVSPTMDSVMMIFSNSLYYLFKFVLKVCIRKYCQHLFPIGEITDCWRLNLHEWPMYFNNIRMGNFFIFLFYFVTIWVEFQVFVVTFFVYLETISQEWRLAKKWIITLLFVIFGSMVLLLGIMVLKVINLLFKLIYVTAECIIITWFYTSHRVFDDITFMSGVSPSRVITSLIRIMPFFQIFKTYSFLSRKSTVGVFESIDKVCYAVLGILLFAGFASSFYTLLIKKDKRWFFMVLPLDTWGPTDFATRQLRKLYDSSNYIKSQGPRSLARHFFTRLKMYRLDIDYPDLVLPSSTSLCVDKKIN